MGILSWFFNKDKTTEVIQQPRVSKKRKAWHQDQCKGSGKTLIGMYKPDYKWVGTCPTCGRLLNATKRGTAWPHKPLFLDTHTKP